MLFWAYFRSVAVGHMLPVVEVLTNQPAREMDSPRNSSGSAALGDSEFYLFEELPMNKCRPQVTNS